MRRIVFGLFLSTLLVAPAFAAFTGGPFTFDGKTLQSPGQVNLDYTGSTGPGGPWSVQLVSGFLWQSIYEGVVAPAPNVFDTFCAESDIGFNPVNDYWFSIDPVVYSGGPGGGTSGDAVSDVTEYIYDRYLAGNPDGWVVQDIGTAIWWAEEELQGSQNAIAVDALIALNYATDAASAALVSASTLGDASHTWALNLWEIDDQGVAQDRQSFLITVPVPAGALLGFFGLAVAGIKLRRSL